MEPRVFPNRQGRAEPHRKRTPMKMLQCSEERLGGRSLRRGPGFKVVTAAPH
jgi:hypothetical protein